MNGPARYPFLVANEAIGKPSSLPILPLTLMLAGQSLFFAI